MKSEQLIKELIEITEYTIEAVKSFRELPLEQLNYKLEKESWSILECIEHLNYYGNFYIPEIKQRLSDSKFKTSENFKSGILGSYFAKSMLPKDKLNKMKTFTSMNPINSKLNVEVLDYYLEQQQEILNLLKISLNTDLTKIKTSISISKFIKLKLGDTFRVVIYHNKRHILQALKTKNLYQN